MLKKPWLHFLLKKRDFWLHSERLFFLLPGVPLEDWIGESYYWFSDKSVLDISTSAQNHLFLVPESQWKSLVKQSISQEKTRSLRFNSADSISIEISTIKIVSCWKTQKCLEQIIVCVCVRELEVNQDIPMTCHPAFRNVLAQLIVLYNLPHVAPFAPKIYSTYTCYMYEYYNIPQCKRIFLNFQNCDVEIVGPAHKMMGFFCRWLRKNLQGWAEKKP